MIGLLAFLLAGVFFVGCGPDYSKLEISANQSYVSLDLDTNKTAEVVFSVSNAPKGFDLSSVVINPVFDEQIVFVCGQTTVSGNTIRVPIEAKAGGKGTLTAKVLEGNKPPCNIDVFVNQHSTKMNSKGDTLYVSEGKSFVPTFDMFEFDDHTTDTATTFYFLKPGGDITGLRLSSFKEVGDATFAVFSAAGAMSIEREIAEFESVSLLENGNLNFVLKNENTVVTRENISDYFDMLAVYDYSLSTENLIYDVCKINILQSLDVEISGAYIQEEEPAQFETIYKNGQFDQSFKNILIVPNDALQVKRVKYLLRVETNDSSNVDSDIFKFDSELVNVDYAKEEDLQNIEYEVPQGRKVTYILINQKSHFAGTDSIKFDIHYDITKDVLDDQSVSFKMNLPVEVAIAPIQISVNGRQNVELESYSEFYDDSTGWQNLDIQILSGWESEPQFDYIWFEFDGIAGADKNHIQLQTSKGVAVVEGARFKPEDLLSNFMIRGQGGEEGTFKVKIFVKSSILPDENQIQESVITLNLISGANDIFIDENFDATFYIDSNKHNIVFDSQLYTTTPFESFTVSNYRNDSNVVDITVNQPQFSEKDGRFYLNFVVNPISDDGTTSRYVFMLDNGKSIVVSFASIKTLAEETTQIRLSGVGNEYVQYNHFSRTEGSNFDNVLELEIQNLSQNGGSRAFFEIISNATEIKREGNNQDFDISETEAGSRRYMITTNRNNQQGFSTQTLKLTGNVIDEHFKLVTDPQPLVIEIKVSSYSLLNEFSLRNGTESALENIVYVGTNNADSKMIKFDTHTSPEGANNFFKYDFIGSSIVDIYNNNQVVDSKGTRKFYINSSNFDSLIHENMNYSLFLPKFVSFNALDKWGNNLTTETEVTIFRRDVTNPDDIGRPVTVTLSFSNGLMFYSEDIESFFEKTLSGENIAEYTMTFTNKFNISGYGTFDVADFTFVIADGVRSGESFSLLSYVYQRGRNGGLKQFSSKIIAEEYRSVSSITLASNIDQISFSNKVQELDKTIGVYIVPANATNAKLKVEFIATNGNPYGNMIDVVDVNGEHIPGGIVSCDNSGYAEIRLSCEDFFNDVIARGIDVSTLSLTGTLYIYPADWGDGYAALESGRIPVKIDVQYRTGSRLNPYLLQTSQDVLDINQSASMLSSNYEIRSVIDMSNVVNATPIGILNGELVGFSGSIIGSTSQSAITNLVISSTNFSKVVNGKLYAGLFARINPDTAPEDYVGEYNLLPSIENLSISGSFDLNLSQLAFNFGESNVMLFDSANVSLLAAENLAKLSNVEVRIQKSSISATATATRDYTGKILFGGLAAINDGEIEQNFKKYEGTFFATESTLQGDVLIDENGNALPDIRNHAGFASKNLAFFEGDSQNEAVLSFVGGNGTVFAGGIVGENHGIISRVTASENYKMYGYSGYSAYTSISFSGNFESIHAGGAVGYATLKSGENLDNENFVSQVEGLLVGGEVSTLNAILTDLDAVGGIVGTADATNIQNNDVHVLNNTSRVFVRGQDYVGAIAGQDIVYGDANETAKRASFGKENVVEAIDSGFGGINASMLIRTNNDKFGSVDQDLIDNENYKNTMFAVGNFISSKKYYPEDSTLFDIGSYVYMNREFIAISNEKLENVFGYSNDTKSYYGDYVVVEKREESLFDILSQYVFDERQIDLNFDSGENSGFKLSLEESGVDFDAYFMYHFAVSGYLRSEDGTKADAMLDIEDSGLNTHAPNSQFYPFNLQSNDVNIQVSSSNILSIDENGIITTFGVGPAEIMLTSIKNVSLSKVIYLYVVNFFDKDTTASVFYSVPDDRSSAIQNNDRLPIFGKRDVKVKIMPSYEISFEKENSKDDIIISNYGSEGILRYNSVDYVLEKNTLLSADVERVSGKGFSSYAIDNQTITFSRNSNEMEILSDDVDIYSLTPKLSVSMTIGGTKYKFQYILPQNNAKMQLKIEYHEEATKIICIAPQRSLDINTKFSDDVRVESSNLEEVLYYSILRDGQAEPVQQKLAVQTFRNKENWLEYINEINIRNDLFNIQFSLGEETNTFHYVIEVNKNSNSYLNRFKEPIAGNYKLYLYASSGESGISKCIDIQLYDVSINNISISNYSSLDAVVEETSSNNAFVKSSGNPNTVIVPGNDGLLEISLTPMEGVWDTFSIKNNEINLLEGSGQANFLFAYERNTAQGVQYVAVPTGIDIDSTNTLTFTYDSMIRYFERNDIDFNGRIYVIYHMPTNGVQDQVSVRFDVSVSNIDGQSKTQKIDLETKLENYARIEFVNKEKIGGNYYVAEGLSYDLRLNLQGFELSDVDMPVVSDVETESTSAISRFATIESAGDGRYLLNINHLAVEDYSNDVGRAIYITTTARKTVGNLLISFSETIKIYIMRYVLNYAYRVGQNEDIVEGMNNGVVSVGVGSTINLRLSIENFLEYDRANLQTAQLVRDFVSEMTQNTIWNVYKDGQSRVINSNSDFKDEDNYYQIRGLSVSPLKIYRPEENIYHFSALAYYQMSEGRYIYSSSELGNNRLYTEFSLNVHNQSADESPTPVRDYDDLMKMDGEYVILLDNIKIPATSNEEVFTQINSNILGLDGNGYSLILDGTYNFGDIEYIGLFDMIQEGVVIKNLNIKIEQSVIFNASQEDFVGGLLAGQNNGIITNCAVISSSKNNTLSVNYTPSDVNANAVFGALVGENSSSGFITNSRSEINIIADVNTSGFVGTNSGHIASSYFSSASLRNINARSNTAGFVLENYGNIYTSYVSGRSDNEETGENDVYYNESRNRIYSDGSGDISGFVYKNDKNANISDCYSNIYLSRGSGSRSSGFVFSNSGLIQNCFSTSFLESGIGTGYGFAQENKYEEDGAQILNCKYLSDDSVNSDVGNITYNGQTNAPGILEIVPLKVDEFKDKENFKDFIIADGRNVNGVWFLNTDESNDEYFGNKKFNVNRPELVAPNIIAFSKREFVDSETVVEGDITYQRYNYIDSTDCDPRGSINNPIVIDSPETFEEYITRENSPSNLNDRAYRLVANITYNQEDSQYYGENTGVYKTRFVGYFEGNFMTISDIRLYSNESLTYAGMFSEIGNSSVNLSAGYNGTVMNLTMEANYVKFNNSSVVGAIAGRVYGGKIFNIDVKIFDEENKVYGKNIVGGAIGLTDGNFAIQNVFSEFGANAINTSGTSQYSPTNINNVSFAGGLIGVLSGRGVITNCETVGVEKAVLANKAGLMFGLIDQNATVEGVELQILDSDEMYIAGYEYAGFVAGESKGTVKNVNIYGSGMTFDNFKTTLTFPKAIGGFAGLVSGGNIDTITMNQSITTSVINSSRGVLALGGIAGLVTSQISVKNATVEAELVGYQYVGGIAGNIDAGSSTIEFENINVKNTYLCAYSLKEIEEMAVGGLAGRVGGQTYVVLHGKTENGDTIKNFIEITVEMHAYIYKDSEMFMYIGNIIGENDSTANHSVNDTKSILKYKESTGYGAKSEEVGDVSTSTANFKVEMVGEEEMQTPTLVYTQTPDDETHTNGEHPNENKHTMRHLNPYSINSEYYVDFTFVTSDPTQPQYRQRSSAILTLYGTANTEENIKNAA